ncbi:MAG: DUF459 domain-containing protein [Kiritimatiellae bacterium]|nr:DUF459 domain-containing protein [Kiritimatiellia bacterium]MBR4190995.1 DUF459 domain-containing protein [Kiritimatiellia bacterium]
MKKLLQCCAMMVLAGLVAVNAAAEEAPEFPQGSTPVLMVGDSMMRILGANMEKEFRQAGIQPAVAFSSLGSGLVRPSVFNWFNRLDELLKENKPETVFVALGTNDKQALETEDGAIVPYGGPAWESAYRECIARFMDQLLAADVDLVVWFLLPPMKDPAVQEHAQIVNRIATELAGEEARKDKFFLYDMASCFSRKPGVYSQYMMDQSGAAIMVRDPDGIHLAVGGAKAVAKACVKNFYKDR